MAASSTRKRLALHWQIVIGLILGLVVGIGVNTATTDSEGNDTFWPGVGVPDRDAFIVHGVAYFPKLPEGTATLQELDPDNPELAAMALSSLTPEFVEKHDLEAKGLIIERPTSLAYAARFVRLSQNFIGKLFINFLKFIAAPIVLCSLIVGTASLNDVRKLGRMGLKTVVLYLCTTAIAITVGLVLVNIVRPGASFDPQTMATISSQNASNAGAKISQAVAADQSVWKTLLNLLPTNPFAALAEGNMLQIVVLSMLLGIGLTLIPESESKPVIRFFDGMTNAIIKLVHVLMLCAPVAVFALIVTVMTDMGLGVLGSLIKYALVVIAGLLVMFLGVYPVIMIVLTRGKVGYKRFYKAIAPAQLLAFSSSSSSATLPVTMDCVENKLGCSEDVTSFVLPLGATVNMDGTALYQGVATVFITQLFGQHLSIMDQLMIVLTATLASIGTAGVPGVGMLMLVIVLQTVHVSAEHMQTGIALIFGVDRILDMCRTTCNVTGDCAVAAIVAATENELASEEEVEQRLAAKAALDEHPRSDDERVQARG
ncbi:MAG: dicarboxylate/amino acid:cation symporter [Phycisphaeraceae bacterium]|nr:dicarboxylate/amino acid:cation symporter [Phycisphaerales bacterium]MCB9859791.1 dicarboxylate/amino acid:cation symporter [Phycisphaeraceae bacterium]